MAMEPRRASPMSKMNGTRLPSTLAILDLYIYFQVSSDDEECCF